MNYYNINIMFKSQDESDLVFDTYNSNISSKNNYLETVLSLVFNSENVIKTKEITIESFKKFTNEIEVSCYGSKYPSVEVETLIKNLIIEHENAIKLECNYGSDGESGFYYLVNGLKATKSKYQGFLKKNKIQDPTVEFVRYLKDYEYKKAYALLDKCDLSKIDSSDEDSTWLYCLLQEEKISDLVIKLIEHKVITEFDPRDKNTWLDEVIFASPLAILKCFFKMDYKAISRDPEVTPVHCALHSATPDSIEKLKLIIDTFPDDLSKVTKYGSPLWQRGENIACCEYLESIRAEITPPLNFYDNLNILGKIIEAAKHNDVNNFEHFYEEKYRNVALFISIQEQSDKIVEYLNHDSSINWLQIISEDFIPSTEKYSEYEGVTLCELGLSPLKYDNYFWQSWNLLELIKVNLAKNVKAMKLSGDEYSRDVISDAKRNFTRYKRWCDKNLLNLD